jgi:prepilin-type N-terminal cleavage/methylation domain-containing protein
MSRNKFIPKIIQNSQGGFTLLEIVISLAIVGALASGITMTISQIFNSNMKNTARMTTVQDVQSAVYWLSRDAQMAQTAQSGGSAGFPLQLNWVEWETNDAYKVSYSLVNGEFKRGISINGGEATEQIVARHIDINEAKTNCSVSGRVLTVSLTSSVPCGSGTTSETRIIEILARPGS